MRNDVDRYFDLLEQIQQAKRKHQYRKMLNLCERSLPLIPSLVKEEVKEYGGFNIASIPAIEIGLHCWAVLGQIDKIQVAENLVHEYDELKFLEDLVQQAYGREDFTRSILVFLKENPGFRQSKVGKVIGISGQTVRWILYYLEKFGRIQRKKNGNTYNLYIK